MKKRTPKGLFCLESEWWGMQDSTTVEPALALLKSYTGSRMPYLHRDVATRGEFDHYLLRWTQKAMAKYPVLYLGFHGGPGELYLHDTRRTDSTITLDEIADRLESRCTGRVIHFGSCQTLDVHGQTLNCPVSRSHPG